MSGQLNGFLWYFKIVCCEHLIVRKERDVCVKEVTSTYAPMKSNLQHPSPPDQTLVLDHFSCLGKRKCDIVQGVGNLTPYGRGGRI